MHVQFTSVDAMLRYYLLLGGVSQLGGRRRVLRLHGREEKHLLDVRLVRQEHGHTVHAHAPASRGG